MNRCAGSAAHSATEVGDVIRALLIAPQWIGDAVMSEPLLSCLAGRGERVTVGALPWVAPVYRAMPSAAEVVELPFAHGRLDWAERRRVARAWRGRFGRAYVLPNSIKAALLPWLARIPERVGYRGEGRFGLLTRRLADPDGRPPMVDFYLALAGTGASAVDCQRAASGDRVPRLTLPDVEIESVLAATGLQRSRYWAFAPGAEYGPAKRWPSTHYAELARSVHASSGLPVVLLGSAAEAPLCREIAALAGPVCRVLAGAVSLQQAMAIIAASRGVVSNDSGLMHVAAAFGVPQVAVFGSTSPLHTPPLNRQARVLWLKDELALDCMPCFERTCRYGHYRCLDAVRPARVGQALQTAIVDPPSDRAASTA